MTKIESAEDFIRLRESEDPHDYAAAAGLCASDEVWMEVIRTRPDMCFWVAQNKTVSLHVLRRLATDSDPRVRSMVASKRSLDRGLFSLLSRDRDGSVRRAIALNKRCPMEVINELRADPWEEVRCIAERRAAL